MLKVRLRVKPLNYGTIIINSGWDLLPCVELVEIYLKHCVSRIALRMKLIFFFFFLDEQERLHCLSTKLTDLFMQLLVALICGSGKWKVDGLYFRLEKEKLNFILSNFYVACKFGSNLKIC